MVIFFFAQDFELNDAIYQVLNCQLFNCNHGFWSLIINPLILINFCAVITFLLTHNCLVEWFLLTVKNLAMSAVK